MAIRVEPDSNLVFGIMDAAVTVTHTRFQKAGADPVVRPVSPNVDVAIGERLRIPSTSFDVVYKTGQLSDDHVDALVKSYWDGEEFQIDCLTDSTTPVADTGYSQATHDSWTFTQEADVSEPVARMAEKLTELAPPDVWEELLRLDDKQPGVVGEAFLRHLTEEAD